MSDFRDIEVRSSNQSLIIAIIVGLISLLLLLITFTFEDTYPKFQPIEIAMNFGTSDVGQGSAEPKPSENVDSPSASATVESQQEVTPSTPIENVVTQHTTETRPVATTKQTPKTTSIPKKASTKSVVTPQPKGDAKANAALNSLLGGKGKSNDGGEGTTGQPGNVGDPKGNDSRGTGIGEEWKSRIPEPQAHDCNASGVIIVEVVVNASGGIKSARPGAKGSTSTNTCLRNKAKTLVEKYVRAYPGNDGRRGSYRVNLR